MQAIPSQQLCEHYRGRYRVYIVRYFNTQVDASGSPQKPQDNLIISSTPFLCLQTMILAEYEAMSRQCLYSQFPEDSRLQVYPRKKYALHLAEQDSHSSHKHQFVAHEESSTLLFNTQSFIFHAQIALSKSWYQVANYCTFPLTCTVIHALKCIQETSYMCVPKSYKNNNPRKQNKEITIAEFTMGAAAYQSNDRKSSPNKVQKSCRTNMTAIMVLKKQERDKSNTGACSQVSSYSSVLKFLVKPSCFLPASETYLLVFVQGQIRFRQFSV